jgi:hypothetical protein
MLMVLIAIVMFLFVYPSATFFDPAAQPLLKRFLDHNPRTRNYLRSKTIAAIDIRD